MEPIQREGAWWHRQDDGSWLRFDVSRGEWQPSLTPPPPPPPPPPLASTAKAKSRWGQDVQLPELSRPVMIALAGALALILLAVAAFSFLGDDPVETDPASPSVAVDTSEPAQTMSKKEQFIHDADQICADIMTQVNKLPTPTTLPEVVAVFEAVKGIALDARARGQALDVPRDAKKGWNRLIGTDEDFAEIDELIASVKAGDVAAIQRYDAQNKGAGKVDRRWAKRYGMAVCSQDLS